MSRLRRSTFIAPTILKGIPFPEAPARVKKHHVTESVWNNFLRRLEVGDCFEIDYCQLGGLKMAAHRLNISLVHRIIPNGQGYKNRARVWRMA